MVAERVTFSLFSSPQLTLCSFNTLHLWQVKAHHPEGLCSAPLSSAFTV